jgi:hypothetical protein
MVKGKGKEDVFCLVLTQSVCQLFVERLTVCVSHLAISIKERR